MPVVFAEWQWLPAWEYRTQRMELTQSVAVVTGGSRGLGKAIVEALRAEGMIVEAPAQEAVDVRSFTSVHTWISDVYARRGRIDILVNNAGWAEPPALLEDVSEEDFDRCMDTNVKGIYNVLHAALPLMKKQKKGLIINIASRAGNRAHPTLSIYSASKFAVRGITQAVARECSEAGSFVTCISVSPGGINTHMRTMLFGKENSDRQQKPEVVAALIVRYLRGDVDFSNGSDVQIVDRVVTKITTLD